MKSSRKIRPTTLHFEKLETRQVLAASVTATLDGNVLRVQDTDRDDDIVVRQHAGQIKVDGVGAWNAAGVKSVEVKLGGGNDFVSLRGLENIDTKVTSKGGIERVKLTDGRDVFFEGLGHELEVASGAAMLRGRRYHQFGSGDIDDNAVSKHAWFALRDDGVLDRTEMIHLFHRVAKDGRVTRPEMNSMEKLVRDSAKFGDLHYVQVLSKYIVLGNKANDHFRGKRLGNLRVGSTGAQLNKLVSKWFLGSDRPNTRVEIDKKWVRFRYARVSGELYSDGIKFSDVRQGMLGDCYLLASLAGAAVKDPDLISEMFIDNGDRTFTVRYFRGTRAEYVTVDMLLPVTNENRLAFANSGDLASVRNKELWVALAEKAYAQINESGWLRRHGKLNGHNSYHAIASGYPRNALAQITGIKTDSTGTNSRMASLADVVRKMRNGDIVTFGSAEKPKWSPVVGSHAYTVIAYNSAQRTLTLFNPWGVTVGGKQPGLLQLTWQQLRANFSSYDYTINA